ncbi:hypothetical protein Hypma_007304 [Hypsizygus marmoreus]|uniref:RING-type domain-containing protein n=1 Tax=Hypsizygus marmoreus TaxID=39966 RepID=A0A369K9J5_HYPMA|nr:hypothetical protein Hypma_007304 [Hypsizygus marmoreus]
MARLTSHKSQPVTPQRLSAQRQQHRYSSSQSLYRSPITPASPYTPLSLRSFTSSGSGGSSTLTTPDNVGLSVKRLSFSPEVASSTPAGIAKDQSLADIAENWRSRASENGIKVSSMLDDSHFGDDEASERTLSDAANDSMFISTEEALLAPPFVTNRRIELAGTRPRAQSHVPPPTSRSFSSPIVNRNTSARALPPTSPLVARRLNQSQNTSVTSTPPPNRALARQLKLKGSFTDPAHTRRREAFGPLRTPQSNVNKSFNMGLNQDTSLDLFDIDENDFEYEYEYNDRDDVDEGSLMELNFRPNTSINDNNTNAYGYPTFSLPLLPSYPQQQFFPPQSQPSFADPFQGHSLTNITESVEHYFHSHAADNNLYLLQDEQPPSQHLSAPPGLGPNRVRSSAYGGNPAWVPLPAPSPKSSQPSVGKKAPETTKLPKESAGPKKATAHTGCSVCLAPHPRTLAVLVPCGHPLCSACLTSALNIVGEKDMECAVCRGKVADFKLILGDNANEDCKGLEEGNAQDGWLNGEKRTTRGWEINDKHTGKSFMDPLFSSPGSGLSVDGGVEALDSAFEFGLGLSGVRASTPKLREERIDSQGKQGEKELEGNRKIRERGRGKEKGEENVVLRIDNVPWDITPPQIKNWLQQPLQRVHVLLDRKGKTMSHAYVEVGDLAVAGKILRGEAGDDNIGKKGPNEKRGGKPRERGSVLGKGRRARGVTVTRSGQEELMADLFPNWRGSFDGTRPSLAGLDNERVIGALEGGLIGESEVVGLLHLIKEPDSHFLKAPSLPFYSLISVLSKFPADVDSRVFWSSSVRDMLYDVTYASVQILLSRVDARTTSFSTGTGDAEYTVELVSELVRTAVDCHAFTAQQLNKFTELLESCSLPLLRPIANPASGSESSARSEPRTPENRDVYGRISNVSAAAVEGEGSRLSPNPAREDGQALAELAREFGVEAQLVQALAQRLAGLS